MDVFFCKRSCSHETFLASCRALVGELISVGPTILVSYGFKSEEQIFFQTHVLTRLIVFVKLCYLRVVMLLLQWWWKGEQRQRQNILFAHPCRKSSWEALKENAQALLLCVHVIIYELVVVRILPQSGVVFLDVPTWLACSCGLVDGEISLKAAGLFYLGYKGNVLQSSPSGPSSLCLDDKRGIPCLTKVGQTETEESIGERRR